MNVGHLFAGAGGGLLASKILGHHNVFAVELERYPAGILRQRAEEGWFPGLHVHEIDARLFDSSEYTGRVDAIHAGFPCQDISVAGAGAGIGGSKSGLWSEVVRVAGILRPRELFLENSPAIVTRGLDQVLGDLVELGYDARWCVLSASAVGAPHLRARWWCLARRAHTDGERNKPRGNCATPVASSERDQKIRIEDERVFGDVPDTDGKRELQPQGLVAEFGRRPGDMGNANDISGRAGAERQNGAQVDDSGWWGIEPALGRVAHGVADRVDRIKAIGNGQVTLCAAAAYTLLAAGFGDV